MRGKVGRARAGERKRWACLSAEWRDAISFRQARNYLSVRRKNRVLWRGYRPFVDPLYLGFQSLSRSPAGWPSRQDLGVLKVDGGSGGGTGHSLTHPLTCEEGGREGRGRGAPTDCCFPFSPHSQECTTELPCCERASERAPDHLDRLDIGVGPISNPHSTCANCGAALPNVDRELIRGPPLFSAAASATTARRTRIRRATTTTAACGARAPTSAAPRPSCPSARPPSSS